MSGRNTPLHLLLAPCFPKKADSRDLDEDGPAFPNQGLISVGCNITYPCLQKSDVCCSYLVLEQPKLLIYLPASHLKILRPVPLEANLNPPESFRSKVSLCILSTNYITIQKYFLIN